MTPPLESRSRQKTPQIMGSEAGVEEEKRPRLKSELMKTTIFSRNAYATTGTLSPLGPLRPEISLSP